MAAIDSRIQHNSARQRWMIITAHEQQSPLLFNPSRQCPRAPLPILLLQVQAPLTSRWGQYQLAPQTSQDLRKTNQLL